MKISKIEYENFRNFRDHGEIICSTDGRVTIVYGKNGDGKTTLHQLFQWIFYGEVHFNKTTSDRLYNLAFESEQAYNAVFDVMGRIDFEHLDTKYSLTRTYTYKKGMDASSKIAEDLALNYMDDDDNWRRIDRPQETIEKLLPPGLADYFFFDGENMIADLRVKGKDSARSLRKALYSIFDLDVYESALNHIGETNLKTTVLGQLYLSKGTIKSSSDINATKTNIENAQNKLESIQDKISANRAEKNEKSELISTISEKIGSTKAKEEYERERRHLIRQRDLFLANVSSQESEFGDRVIEEYPQMFIAKTVEAAKGKLHLKVENDKLPDGVTKRLIAYLLAANKCICGEDLDESHKQHIEAYLNMMPPRSYSNLYQKFTQTAKQWGRGYDREKLESYIRGVISNQEQAEACDAKIRALDEEEKNSKDIESLVVDRRNAEERVAELDRAIIDGETELNKYNIYLKKQMKQYDELTEASKSGAIAAHKIKIMEEVRDYFRNKLDEESRKYSEGLQENIQGLLNKMLTSRRTVSVSPEFSVRVIDSFKDESKSEGQFAVVSFAYIGAILKLVTEDSDLIGKEYPLVLDGPFSKLDPDQRQNVIDTIPEFAPQVILFSKDGLQEYFKDEVIGRVYTIESNEEKNIAQVKEGYLWS